jgi:PPOX class probable F420-dependent enzyme
MTAATDADSTTAATPFDRFTDKRNALLTTYKRDGTPVGTPVHIAVDGRVAYVRTFDPSGKLKRIRNNPRVELAPSTLRGRPTGPTMRARARILAGEPSTRAAAALAKKYPLARGCLIPWYHRRKGLVTTQLELTAA